MLFCVYPVLSNGPNWEDFLHNINASGNFWSKFGFLTPGVPIYKVTLNCHAIDIEDIASRFNLNLFLWLLCAI